MRPARCLWIAILVVLPGLSGCGQPRDRAPAVAKPTENMPAGGAAGSDSLPSAERDDPSTGPLTLQIVAAGKDDPRTIDYRHQIRVVLTNTSDAAVGIVDPESARPLPFRLHFVHRASGEKFTVEAPPDDEGGSESGDDAADARLVEIAPGQSLTSPISLSIFHDVTPDDAVRTTLPDPNTEDVFSVAIEFVPPETDEARRRQAWTGRVRSPSIDARLVDASLKSPHDYLRNGYPRRAIALIEKKPELIEALDSDHRTPLHLAAWNGHSEAVALLLDHGADVNEAASNRFTALHLTKSPRVVEILLRVKPDLTLTDVENRTPPQRAAVELSRTESSDADRARWRKILDLYRAAGAKDDLFVAIYLDEIARVKEILATTPESADDFQGESPLRLAASLGRLEICRHLLRHFKVDVDDFERGVGFPIIIEALGHPEIVRLLIENKADLKTRITWQGGRSGYWIIGDDATALHYAAADGVPETIRLLIDQGVEIDATDHGFGDRDPRQTALEVAARYGAAENARAILDHPKFAAGDPAIRQRSLDNALLGFAQIGKAEMVEQLIKARAKTDHAVETAATRIHPTEEATNAAIGRTIALLVKHGARIDLYSAVSLGDEAIVQEILKRDPKEANARGGDGCPALHRAVEMNFYSIVEALLEAGADIDIRNESKTTGMRDGTALHAAAFWGRDDIARLLIDAGADVNAAAKGQVTPLHEAARLGKTSMMRLLVDKGANRDARDSGGKTPADWSRDGRFDSQATQRLLAPSLPKSAQ